MRELFQVMHAAEWGPWEAASSSPSFDSAWLDLHLPDSHWVLLDKGRRLCGHCSVWWRQVPSYPGHRPGLIGHYFASDRSASDQLLTTAIRKLAERGCTLAIGLMDGNSWRRYRLISDRGQEPPFFMEPENPDCWTDYFQVQGFVPLAKYISTLHQDQAIADPRLEQATSRLTAAGVEIRQLRLAEFEEELARIFTVSGESFQHNLFYTPIPEAEFLNQYQVIRPLIQPELVLLAVQNERPVGFCFAIPDYLEMKRLGRIETLIIKTLAILKERPLAGLGSLLVQRCEARAFNLGFRRIIHALMHVSNYSRNISRGQGSIIRRYTLYVKSLEQL